jgi:hypothetical protein
MQFMIYRPGETCLVFWYADAAAGIGRARLRQFVRFAKEALNKIGGGREGRVSEAVPACTQRDVFCSLQRLERIPPDLFRGSLRCSDVIG